MKPPHGNRPSGPTRPPGRGPQRGFPRGPGGSPQPPGQGGPGPRPQAQRGGTYGGPQGGAAGGSFKGAPRGVHGGAQQGAHHGAHPNEAGGRDHQKPRPQGGFQLRANPGAPARAEGRADARSQGPRHEGLQPRNGGQAHRPREHEAPRRAPEAPKGTVWLYGNHAVAAALANPSRRLRRLLLTEEAEAAITKQLAPPWAVAPERVDRARLDHLLGRDIVHQGAALLADPLAPPSLQSVLEKSGVIVVLDQVTDPRNVGAILRSAAAFGAAAVVTQDRNAPEETGGLAKAASGALETMPLLRAVNITRTLIALKAANVWCIGLDAAGPALSGPAFADRRVALVLGAEGEGLRRLTRETCDEVAGLTIKGAVESLNVSAAASVALYELARR